MNEALANAYMEAVGRRDAEREHVQDLSDASSVSSIPSTTVPAGKTEKKEEPKPKQVIDDIKLSLTKNQGFSFSVSRAAQSNSLYVGGVACLFAAGFYYSAEMMGGWVENRHGARWDRVCTDIEDRNLIAEILDVADRNSSAPLSVNYETPVYIEPPALDEFPYTATEKVGLAISWPARVLGHLSQHDLVKVGLLGLGLFAALKLYSRFVSPIQRVTRFDLNTGLSLEFEEPHLPNQKVKRVIRVNDVADSDDYRIIGHRGTERLFRDRVRAFNRTDFYDTRLGDFLFCGIDRAIELATKFLSMGPTWLVDRVDDFFSWKYSGSGFNNVVGDSEDYWHSVGRRAGILSHVSRLSVESQGRLNTLSRISYSLVHCIKSVLIHGRSALEWLLSTRRTSGLYSVELLSHLCNSYIYGLNSPRATVLLRVEQAVRNFSQLSSNRYLYTRYPSIGTDTGGIAMALYDYQQQNRSKTQDFLLA